MINFTHNTVFLGPGTVGEAGVLARTSSGRLKTEDLLKATGSVFDAFSYHLYPAVSQRCAARMPAIGATASAALSKEWLARPLEIHTFYADLRDRLVPGKPLWLTETADAACGGIAWATTFLGTFRYLNQAASLAQRGVQVSAHIWYFRRRVIRPADKSLQTTMKLQSKVINQIGRRITRRRWAA